VAARTINTSAIVIMTSVNVKPCRRR
jgi:hypothetical protein